MALGLHPSFLPYPLGGVSALTKYQIGRNFALLASALLIAGGAHDCSKKEPPVKPSKPAVCPTHSQFCAQ